MRGGMSPRCSLLSHHHFSRTDPTLHPPSSTLHPSVCVSPSTILKGLGLEGKLTADQIAKKWDNLRTKYKVIFFWQASGRVWSVALSSGGNTEEIGLGKLSKCHFSEQHEVNDPQTNRNNKTLLQ